MSNLYIKRGAKLKAPDGRWTYIRKANSILNSLCQMLGSVVMKNATVIAHQLLEEKGVRLWDESMPVGPDQDQYDAVMVIN